jgi:HAD superfamily hydrolase (TIGR01548 family)
VVSADLLVFDMDGVLVEVGESYRETIVQTVKHFTGQTITRERIQDYKNQGGWNNDWALSQRIIADLGVAVAYEPVVEQFNRLWMGHDGVEGLVARERWIGGAGLFERLLERYRLAIFTGRARYELDITIERFARGIRFDPIICAEDVSVGKPDPDGLLRIRERNPGKRLLYFGDVIDDARSARAAVVPFVGVVAAGHPRRATVLAQFEEEGAVAVIENINEIEDVLR